MTQTEVIKKHGIPDNVFVGNVDELNKIHQDARFKNTQIIHNPKRYKNLVFQYKRDLIEIKPAQKSGNK